MTDGRTESKHHSISPVHSVHLADIINPCLIASYDIRPGNEEGRILMGGDGAQTGQATDLGL